MGISTQLALCCPGDPHALLSCQISLVSDNISSPLSSMHGLDKVAHVSHVPGFASVGGFGRQAFPAVDRYPAPAPAASVGWAPGSAPATLDGQLSPQSTAISPGSLGDGRRREATLRRRGFDFCRQPLLFGPGFGFCGTTVMVVLARGPGCPSRHEPARSQGFGIPADNFPNELARV